MPDISSQNNAGQNKPNHDKSNLFTYGSLMYDEIWTRLTTDKYKKIQAELDGYVRKSIKGEVFPALIKGDGSTSGILYLDVSKEDMQTIDIFEGDIYKRIEGKVLTENGKCLTCFFYVLLDSCFHIISDDEWDPLVFEKTGLNLMIGEYPE